MNASIKVWLTIAAVLICLDIFVVFRLLLKRIANKIRKELLENPKSSLVESGVSGKSRRSPKYAALKYLQMKQLVFLDFAKKSSIEKSIDLDWAEKKFLKGLKSAHKTKRIESAVYLGLLGTEKARENLEKSILVEKNAAVTLYIANALSDIGSPASIPALVSSLINSNHFYRNKVNLLISNFGEDLNVYLQQIQGDMRIEIKELIVDCSSVHFSEFTKNFLVKLIDTRENEIERLNSFFGSGKGDSCANCLYSSVSPDTNRRICRFKGDVNATYRCHKYKILPVSINSAVNYTRLVYKACNVLSYFQPQELDNSKYLDNDDAEIRNIAVKSLANYNSVNNLDRLFTFLGKPDTSESAEKAISMIIEKNSKYINTISKAFQEESNTEIRQKYARILSRRIEYFIMKLSSRDRKDAIEIITVILRSGRCSEVVDFLNKNKDLDIENELIAIIKQVVAQSSDLEKEFSNYLNERISTKCGLSPQVNTMPKMIATKDKKLIANLYVLLAVIILIFPVIYCIRHQNILFIVPFIEQLKTYVIDFNYYIAFYSMSISIIYLVLLFLSYMSAKKQARLWEIKNMSLLFKTKMLPSVSIIAPAYNEAKTIIESANSLLNLKYPDYELIIVNDGSKDSTIDVLIKYFDLTRVDYGFRSDLHTKQVRGIYVNRSMPKLIVVDKANGGKADSINAGINISHKEYFCCIDADSLLEDDALLKIASLSLDEAVETPALGGNIIPINGCSVEQGQIKNIKIPENWIAKIQTMEYIRAFMSGRLGWASINSLLIISGAFGLFRKERVIDVGGYLTSSGKYEKDTVGEDMELVVRISRSMREHSQKYKIGYAFNANCWTEVPEDLKTLQKQRYRWQRGLIDIVTFHRKMLFNPRYGRTGMIAMPYYYIFEMMGPLVEIQGYLMVVLAAVFGLLYKELALILFVSTILMGVLISVSSLVIEEMDSKRFEAKDLITLIIYSVLENLGPRQLFSFWRVGGYFSMLKTPGGWDKAERKGFSSSNVSDKEKMNEK